MTNSVFTCAYEKAERSYQKQPTVFLNRKKLQTSSGAKSKIPRYTRNVGLGFKAPRDVNQILIPCVFLLFFFFWFSVCCCVLASTLWFASPNTYYDPKRRKKLFRSNPSSTWTVRFLLPRNRSHFDMSRQLDWDSRHPARFLFLFCFSADYIYYFADFWFLNDDKYDGLQIL